MFDIIKDLLDEYGEGIGKIVRIWIGPKLLIILSDPKHIEVRLNCFYLTIFFFLDCFKHTRPKFGLKTRSSFSEGFTLFILHRVKSRT